MSAHTMPAPWRERLPRLHEAVGEIHNILSSSEFANEIARLPREIEARLAEESDSGDALHFIPPVHDRLGIAREPDRLEILRTLVYVCDVCGDFPPLIPKDDPLVKGEMLGNLTNESLVMASLHQRAKDSWAEPLLSRARAVRSSVARDSGCDSVDVQEPMEADGPCGGYRWRHDGVVSGATLKPRLHALATYLHKRIGSNVPFTDLIGINSVFGSGLTDADRTIARQGRYLNKWLEEQGIPLSVGSNTRDGFIFMQKEPKEDSPIRVLM